ncbi:MAG: TonB-dependent receptor [Cytophagales bacterium]|nr:TonB-dependent receptor [Cytophagales bacterium]
MYQKRFFSGLFILTAISSFAQSAFTISGNISDAHGNPVPGISIVLKNTTIGDATDLNGDYQLKIYEPGNYTIVVTGIGYESRSQNISLKTEQIIIQNFKLRERTVSMDEVVITGQSEAEALRLKGYAVEVIESNEQKNLTADINQVLKGTSGVNLRESGGLGSGFKLSLNGLSGNQIRYFIDGVPMENFGSALTLNNFQVNLIDKLEVYKGVVPVALGADALGGAINIVTGYRQKSFLDVSYSYGSFNTHRGSFNGQYADEKNRYFVKLAAFVNHSDNNYEMKNVPLYDLELGNYLGDIRTKRFHDNYTSGMLFFETGLFNRSLADNISIGLTYANNRKNYQHPDNNIKRVFGHFHTDNETFLASAKYDRQFKKIHLKAFVNAGQIEEDIVDASTRKYNWAGDFIERAPEDPRGELLQRRSHLVMTDKILNSHIGLDYEVNDNHSISFSFTQNHLDRMGKDLLDAFNKSFASPSHVNKNILGLAYSFASTDSKLKTTAFGKSYWYRGRIITQDYENNDVTTEPDNHNNGFGAAISYKIMHDLLIKASYEKAFRLPESYEILGDGIYVNPNSTLRPEKSNNFNFGARYAHQFPGVRFKAEANYFYRFSEDFIRFNPLGPFGEYENLNNVKTEGVEGSIDVNYRDLISLHANITYQNLTDRTEFDEGLPNTNYKSRVPNIPYFFYNIRFGISPSKRSSENKFSMYWHTRYIHEFFLIWENLGNPNEKNIIPTQLIHDLQGEYSMRDGRYNVSLTISNLADALVYDNFSIQKPGRAVYLKLRYFLH